MKFIACIFIYFISYSVFAEDLSIKNVKIRPAIEDVASATIYLSIENKSNQIKYLLGAQVIGYPNSIVNINKTVIEKTISRIIKIDRLAIPSQSTINLLPLGIYMVIKKIPLEVYKSKTIDIRFIFENNEIVMKNISL